MMIFSCLFHQLFQQKLCDQIDMDHMQTTFSVSELNNLAQDTDQHPVISLFFVNLPGHQMDQSPLFCI